MRLLLLLTFAFIHFAMPAKAQSSGNQVIIRDTEIEYMIREWARPVIEAADLTPESINIILIRNSQINAFVAGGQNIFIYTGLLEQSENASEIVGVIAHELGHIRGGHLVRTREALQNASYETIVGTLLGVSAALLTGDGRVASAVLAGSQATALNRFLAYSRVQESSADQAGLDYMERAGINPQGLVGFMEHLENQELLPASQQVEYIRTHPLTSNRLSALREGLRQSAYKDKAYPSEWGEQHARLKAKLIGFVYPERVAWDYDDRDGSVAARYARAIAAYRQNRVEESLRMADELISAEPDNPFFHELKGQMLVEFGRVEQGLPYYRKAVELYPAGVLLRVALAHALIEAAAQDNETARLEEAAVQLQRSVREERRSPRVFRLLATAYGRLGHDDIAKLYLAEEALLNQNIPYAKRQAQAALETLKENTPPWVRAQDILNAIERAEKKQEEK